MTDASTNRKPPVPAGEFPFAWEDFHQIAALVHGEAGIVLPDNKANLVYSRLAKRLRAIGLRSFRDYCELIARDDAAEERQALIAAMTTNVTKFFRESHHFEHLETQVLPSLVETARRGGRVRIWSAGCSSGEEPYSIALSLLRVMPDAASHDVLILASDIDPDMIARAEKGTYPAGRIADIPAPMRGGIEVDRAEECFHFTSGVKRLVRFRRLNLLRPWPMRGAFQAIFCRNVMIYFDQPTQTDIWTRFAAQLTPSGHLYIGHSERIASDGLPFTLVGQTIYQRKETNL